jgi:N6-L-threonylcarbamoyladenine synthase
MMGQAVVAADVAASFQQAVIDVLVKKSMAACLQTEAKQLAIAGGVASNSSLRTAMADACAKNGIGFFVPQPVYCTDNAAMIASCAYFDYIKGVRHDLALNAYPSLKISERINA